ncbi:MAG: MarR family transcriptional regulator [Bacteroidia bacterium]|nr:MarR family transcriptional regulator [Bacteroidia bacterium]
MSKSSFDIRFQEKNTAAKIVAGLERIAEAFRVLIWERAKKLGLSPIQIQLLIFIAHHEQKLCNVSHLAQEFNLTKPTISDAIRVLAKKGLIKKEASAVDKRAYFILLSEEGKKIVGQTEGFAHSIYEGVEMMEETVQESLFGQISELIQKLNQQGILSVQRNCQSCRFYSKKAEGHYCQLLSLDLADTDLRIDCAEHELFKAE